MPVYFRIEEGVIEDMHFAEMGGNLTDEEWRDEVDKLIKGGLRAQLVMQSFVTGQSIIDIDFHPDEPRKLTNIDPAVVEIPTVETSIGKMMNKLENLPLDQLVNKAVDTLTGIDQLVRSQEVRDTVHNANLALQSAHKLLNNVDLKVDPLATSAKGTIDQARGTLVSVEKKLDTTLSSFTRLSRNLNRQVKPLSKSAIGALDSIDGLVGTESGTRADLDNMINELAEAARSLRILANYLEQHPESLIKGKGY